MNQVISYLDKPWLKHYDEGVPTSLDYDEVTLVDSLEEAKAGGMGVVLVPKLQAKLLLEAKLAVYKPPTSVAFRSELPKSMLGKILRKEPREQEETHAG